jgi:thiosulfate reductase cytochrome b subunit
MASLAPPIGITTAPQRFYRHRLIVRLTHWTNAVAILVLLMSGLQIFNAHPALYWGQYGADYDNAHRWLEIGAVDGPDGKSKGMTRIGPVKLTTTGVLGLSDDAMGQPTAIGFPHWVTLPSYRDLATGRRWHFFFAWVLILNGLTYLLAGIANGHFRKNLLPTGAELAPRNILHDIGTHIRLQFPKGEDAKRYHILQKLAYCGIVFVVLPLIVLTGLTMSPSNDAAWHWLSEVFGGRQSARSLHFICANLVVLFVVVHLVMVVLAGPINEIRSMITGWFTVTPEDAA